MGLHIDLAIQQTLPYASHHSGTSTGAASQRFTCATLIDAQYDVAAESQYQGKTALIMGKLYRRGGEWKFSAIGDAYPDGNLCETIKRIITNYK